jgi:hypothetical protein
MLKKLKNIEKELKIELKDNLNKFEINKQKKQSLDNEIKTETTQLIQFIFEQQAQLLKKSTRLARKVELNLNNVIKKQNEILSMLKKPFSNNEKILTEYEHLMTKDKRQKIDFDYKFKQNNNETITIGNLLTNKRKPNNNLSAPTISYLNKKFLKNQRPNQDEIKIITSNTILTNKQVSNWFLNKRLDEKKILQPKNKTTITKFQFENTKKEYLLNEYDKNKYPNKQTLERISLEINLTPKQVETWFKNKRHQLDDKKSSRFSLKNLSITSRELLFKEFEKNKYPNDVTLKCIAEQVCLTQKQVKAWFKNKRYKLDHFDNNNNNNNKNQGSGGI